MTVDLLNRGSNVPVEHPHQHLPDVSLVALATLISRLKAPNRCFELDRSWIFFTSFSTKWASLLMLLPYKEKSDMKGISNGLFKRLQVRDLPAFSTVVRRELF